MTPRAWAKAARQRSLAACVAVCCMVTLLSISGRYRAPLALDQAGPSTGKSLSHQASVKAPGSVKPVSLRLKHPVWWMAPYLDGASMGAEAALFVMTLLEQNLTDMASTRIGLLQGRCQDQFRDTQPPHTFDTLLKLRETPLQSPAVVVCHNMPMTFGRPTPMLHMCEACPNPDVTAAYTVARAMAETDRVPTEYAEPCNSLDEVWVPCAHSKAAMINSGVEAGKVHILPPITNTSSFDPARYQPLKTSPEQQLPFQQVFGPHSPDHPSSPSPDHAASQQRQPVFRFVSVFKWEMRKGWDVLLAAYLNEFSSQDKVALYIITRPWQGVEDTSKEIRQWAADNIPRASDQLPRLFVTTSRLHDDQYRQLLVSCQAFVLPTRGEGWGLPLVEAMSMGLPVIATNYSGPADYVDDKVGYPVAHREVPVPDEVEEWFFRGFKWAEPDADHLKLMMRRAVTHPAEAKAKGRAARRRIVDRYSPEAMSVKLSREFKRIEDKLAVQQEVSSGGSGGDKKAQPVDT